MPPEAAAPAAPAAAPAAPASRETLPAVPTEQPEKDWMGEVGLDLDAMDEDNPKPDKGRQRQERQPARQEEEHEERQAEAGKKKEDEQQPPEDKTPVRIPELRKAYETQKKRIREQLEPEIQKLTAKIKELETASPGDPKVFQDKIAALEKQNAELEAHMQYLDYQKSSDFQNKYWKPYVKAYEEAWADIQELKVEEADGKTRRATEADIHMLTQMSAGDARARANAMFGDSADDVILHVRELRKLAREQSLALEEAKTKSAEKLKLDRETAQANSARVGKLWSSANQQLSTKYPKWFAPVQGDTEGNARWEKGAALADLLFAGPSLTPAQKALLPEAFRNDLEAHGKLSPENQVRFHALIRNKAANHDRLAFQNMQLRKELAQVKKSLSEFEASEPPGPGSRGTTAPRTRGGRAMTVQDEYEADIDALERKSRV